MSFASASRKAEDVKQGGSNFINSSGVYEVEIKAAFVSVSNGGSTSVDLFVDHNGQDQVIYGNLRITNNDGSRNEIGSKIFNQLLIISGIDDVSDPVDGELPIAEKGKMKDVPILEDLSDIKILMRIQMEYGAWNGNITEKKIIKGFFRAEDKATAEEIVNDTNHGEGYEKESKYFSNVTYNDNMTEKEVSQWIKDKRPKGTATDSYSEDSNSSKNPPKFGSKRFGKDKDKNNNKDKE